MKQIIRFALVISYLALANVCSLHAMVAKSAVMSCHKDGGSQQGCCCDTKKESKPKPRTGLFTCNKLTLTTVEKSIHATLKPLTVASLIPHSHQSINSPRGNDVGTNFYGPPLSPISHPSQRASASGRSPPFFS